MKSKSANPQDTILLAINKLGKSIRSEFKRTEKALRGEILRVEESVENLEDGQKNLEDGQKQIKAKLEKMDNTLISFVGRVDTLETENEIGTDQIHELRETTKDHEKRIAKLESSN